MRLTLRTLLAYLDEALMSPENRQQLQQKLADSDATQSIVDRIQALMVQPRMACPSVETAGTLDVNNVADYLDGCLDAALVKRFEQVSVRNDGALAEVAAVHQVLTRMIEQPIDIPPRLRDRIYQIPFELSSDESLSLPQATPSTDASNPMPSPSVNNEADVVKVADRSLGRQVLEAASRMLLPASSADKQTSDAKTSESQSVDVWAEVEDSVESQAAQADVMLLDTGSLDAANMDEATEVTADANVNADAVKDESGSVLVAADMRAVDSQKEEPFHWRWAIVMLLLFAWCCVWWNLPTGDETASVDELVQQKALDVRHDVLEAGQGGSEGEVGDDREPTKIDPNPSPQSNRMASEDLSASEASIAALLNTGASESTQGLLASDLPRADLSPPVLPGSLGSNLSLNATAKSSIEQTAASMIPALAEDPSQSSQDQVGAAVEPASLNQASPLAGESPSQFPPLNSSLGASEPSLPGTLPGSLQSALPGTLPGGPSPGGLPASATGLPAEQVNDSVGGNALPGLPQPQSNLPNLNVAVGDLGQEGVAGEPTAAFAIRPLPPIESMDVQDGSLDHQTVAQAPAASPFESSVTSNLSAETPMVENLPGEPVDTQLPAASDFQSNPASFERPLPSQLAMPKPPLDDSPVQWLEQIGTVVVEDQDSLGQSEDWVMVLPGGISKLNMKTKGRHHWDVMFSGISKYSLQQVDEAQRLSVRRCFMVLRSSAENETFQITTPKGDFYITPLSADSEMVIEVRPFLPAGFTADTTAPRFYLGCLGISGKFVIEHNQREEMLVPNKWLVVKPDGQVEQFKSEIPEMIATAISDLKSGQVSSEALQLSAALNSSYGLTKLADIAKGLQVEEQGGTVELRSLAGIWSYYLGRMEPVVSILNDPRLKDHWENHIQTIASCLQTEPTAILQLERAFVDQLMAQQVTQRFAGFNPQTIKKSQMTQLVDDLSSENLARRILAAYALKQLTHETYDYDPVGDADSFKQSITKWRKWLDDSTTARISLSPAAALVPNAKK